MDFAFFRHFSNIKNWLILTKVTSKFGIHEYALIKEYLSILLSWPVIFLIIALFFIIKFSGSIKVFLENSRLSKAGPFELAQHQEPTTPSNRPPTITSESFLFPYLNLALVFNTKVALLWFYTQPTHSATKAYFMISYQLPPIIVKPNLEKEAIFSALLANQLLEGDGNTFHVTQVGEQFLRFLNFISI